MNPGIISIIFLVVLFILMKLIATVRTESKKINDKNPYLHPEYIEVLPEEMRYYPLPPKPYRSVGYYERVWKKILDTTLSFFGLLILSPVFLILCIAVFIDDPGPVFFTQRRVGKDKTFFQLHNIFETVQYAA